MEITPIKVPTGIRYLSQWKEFDKQLPQCHFILNKAHTGVGATQYFLTNSEKVILCSPRCSLIENKRKKHPDVCYYRYIHDNAVIDNNGKKEKPKKKATYEDILKYNNEVISYINCCKIENKVPKIMVTYDSLGHVISAIKTINEENLEDWTLVIDEFQAIFSDATYKSLTEMNFLENSQNFKRAIFMSATPYLKIYMDQLDEFKNLPYLKLIWPKEMEETAIVTNITLKKSESRSKVCKKIIESMRAGKTVRFGNKEIDTKEAVFYINNVTDIVRIVNSCKLKEDEVNILCSRSNEDKLKKAGLKYGNFPKEGEKHKMFTFCTRSVYLGVDFFSECAYSYVFADPSQETLALDISTDLPQILGRQRLDRNPYCNEAILFIKENSLGLDDKEFSAYIENKKKITETIIKDFPNQSTEMQKILIDKYRSSMEYDRYKKDYLMVVTDKKTGEPVLGFNTLYMLAEIRAWEIKKKNLSSKYSIIREQQSAGIAATTGTQSINQKVLAFKDEFEKTGITDQKIRIYSEFRKENPDLVGEIDFISTKYSSYWDSLGYENLRALGFKESRIKAAISEPEPFEKIDELVKEVRDKLEEKKYLSEDLKKKLGKIYEKIGCKKTAKAKDIEKYLTVKLIKDSKTRKDGYQIQSLYQKKITLFPFAWRPNIPIDLTIDRFLEIIKSGEYKIKRTKDEERNLKDVISEIRKIGDHKKQGKLKRDWLPIGCINGKFKYKGDHGLLSYSSFLALDYDGFTNKEEMNKAKEELKKHPFVYAIFETPSGLGLKAIVLHDSANPEHHWNLYKQVMSKCKMKETDEGIVDLSRGQFLSYDPDLWLNPSPVAYHFEYDKKFERPKKIEGKYVAAGETYGTEDMKLDSWTEKFLDSLWGHLLTDDAVMERLDKYWKENRKDYYEVGNRHKSMLVMAGTLCKAGIDRERTLNYLTENYSDKNKNEINEVVEYSYNNNAFGCDRRRYRG